VRQADRILVVAGDGPPPAADPLQHGMQAEGPHMATVRRELLLVHREKRAVYPGTSEWLAKHTVAAHHHVAADSPSDFSRLARFLAGRATGLVLGGGGTRCFAHVGVIRALEEAGVEIDVIGGTSMGAYIAAQYALGWDHARMRAYNRETWVRVRPMQDYTFPVLSLLTGRGFRKVARDIAGDTAIEDLATRFFCVSSNLTRARIVTHRQGPLWRGMVASISVPGLTPPVAEGGDLLVDGAVLDNLPVDVMRALCDGTVIASDVSPAVDLAVDPGAGVSAGLWSRLSPWRAARSGGRKPPTIVDVLSRVSTLNSTVATEAVKRQADLYLHPPTEDFTVVDWKRAEALVDVGYAYAVRAVDEWLARAKGSSATLRRRLSGIGAARGQAPRS
jgi:predicted acylesterase/phospholipase RssA